MERIEQLNFQVQKSFFLSNGMVDIPGNRFNSLIPIGIQIICT